VNGKKKTNAMLDGGSEISIIDQSLAKKLGVRMAKEQLKVTKLESSIHKERQVCCVTLSSIDQTYVLDNNKLMLAQALPTTNCPVLRNKDLLD
jgi:hypothetical protein